ncbi:MAG: YceI family protein [Halieaceae bacterium]|jgi:polyisoprenoid-binding protein YceI|nr:YceI family protein [Halieaceae bacterium]MBT7312379.1 YceI family protein [Halieaceae bacterium]
MPIWIRSLTCVLLLLVTQATLADWRLTAASKVGYVSIKNNAIAEHNYFSGVTGSLNKKGQLKVSIDLSTVETQVDIRNQRMRDLFFEVMQYPEAVVTAQLDMQELAQVESGAPLELVKPFTLSLHGIESTGEAHLRIVSVGGRAWVSTVRPILISAADFGLEGGVAALRKIAGLEAIAAVVPVSVNLKLVEK